MTREQIDQIAQKYERKYGLPTGFISAVIEIESAYNPDAYRDESKGRYSIGLMQVLRGGGAIDEWEKIHGRQQDYRYYDPEYNIRVGAWYLGEKIPAYLERYELPNTIRNVIVAYNAGIGNLIKGRVPLVTQNYLRKVSKLTSIDLDESADVFKLDSQAFFFSCPCCGHRLEVSAVTQAN